MSFNYMAAVNLIHSLHSTSLEVDFCLSQTQEMENMKKYFTAAFFKYIGKPEMTGNQKREMSSKYMS